MSFVLGLKMMLEPLDEDSPVCLSLLECPYSPFVQRRRPGRKPTRSLVSTGCRPTGTRALDQLMQVLAANIRAAEVQQVADSLQAAQSLIAQQAVILINNLQQAVMVAPLLHQLQQ